jgi:hypothetical protein
MFDVSNDSRTVEPRLSVQIEPDGTWTAFRGGYSDEAGRGYRSEAGRCSDVKPATIPI